MDLQKDFVREWPFTVGTIAGGFFSEFFSESLEYLESPFFDFSTHAVSSAVFGTVQGLLVKNLINTLA